MMTHAVEHDCSDVGGAGAVAAHAENFVLVFAATPNAGAKAELTALVQAVYRKIGPGDLVVAYDATHERIVARVEVPNRPSIGTNRNLKASLINSQFGKIWDFLDAGPAEGEAGDVAPARFLATDLPRIMDELPGRTAQVILAGSALYNDAREPSFSMNGGYVPTDAQLSLGQDKSPYGVAGRDKALQGATVHVCYTDAPMPGRRIFFASVSAGYGRWRQRCRAAGSARSRRLMPAASIVS